ncbi:acyl-coenzyme A diphosphatase NUDT19 isoform X1 [Saccopteryx bilineata]|uniref:acyl-coenzyme A diphosphatase NUDT19 isoform X1 n=1 Tax=Saccopteryx bilineata TaxID=59482 RepID=UPI00338D4102
MSGVLRSGSSNWRRAATVVLVAGWPPSSPAAGSLPPPPAEDFRMLFLQRSQQQGFSPGAHVFPGGVVDAADSSPDWLGLFAPHHRPPYFGLSPAPFPRTTFPVLWPTGPDAAKLDRAALPDDIALRICAIRETFEEAGVLLLRPRTSLAPELQPGRALPAPENVDDWRERVHRDPHHFLRLCAHLDCTPDIWALHSWSGWVTPFLSSGSRRFDTAFFLCCLRDPPPVSPEFVEVMGYQWLSPSEATASFTSKEIILMPPQFYEIRRLKNFASLSDLHKFCLDHALEEVERWMPIILQTADGIIHLLPGDDLYIEDSNLLNNHLSTEKKTEEIMNESKKLHRIVWHNHHFSSIYVTVQSKYKHVYPKNYIINKSYL